jgi:hypothetical protein
MAITMPRTHQASLDRARRIAGIARRSCTARARSASSGCFLKILNLRASLEPHPSRREHPSPVRGATPPHPRRVFRTRDRPAEAAISRSRWRAAAPSRSEQRGRSHPPGLPAGAACLRSASGVLRPTPDGQDEGHVGVVRRAIDRVHERRPGRAAGGIGAMAARAEPVERHLASTSPLTQHGDLHADRRSRPRLPLPRPEVPQHDDECDEARNDRPSGSD